MTDHIRITNMYDSLALRANSALAMCTTVESDAAGKLIVPNWPSLSSGESLLWRVMGWLNGSDDLPTASDLRAGLDGPNLKAASVAIGGGLGVAS